MKKVFSVLLAVLLIFGMFACSNPQTDTTNEPAQAEQNSEDSSIDFSGRKTVKIWWLLGGAESDAMLAVCDLFNQSQTEYYAEGLSVDLEKTITAMSGKDSPDVIWMFTSAVAGYAEEGIIENLDSYVSNDGFDTSCFTDLSVQASSYQGSLYGMPLNTSTCALFYNMDLLEAAGYTEPPKTMEELYTMAVQTSVINSDGDLEVMGFPLFDPYAYQQEGVYAFGGRYADDLGNYTPDDAGIIQALQMNVDYRDAMGADAVNKFMANAATNVYSANDVFFKGQQTFRFDGPWLTAMIKANAPDLNYGITLIPGSDNQAPGAGRIESAMLMMATNAQEKEGAFALMKFFTTGDAVKQLDLAVGWVPADKSLYEDPDIQAVPGYSTFIEQIATNNGVIFPMTKTASEYSAKITEYFELVYNGKMTPEAAMNELKEKISDLQ